MNLPGPTSTSAINAVEGTEITDFLKIKIQNIIWNETAARLAQLGHGRAPVCSAGDRGFKFRPVQRPGSLNKLVRQMIVSLVGVGGGGDVSPLALYFSSFFH